MLLILLIPSANASFCLRLFVTTVISKQCKFHRPLTHTQANTNSPPSPPPSHHPTIVQSPIVNAHPSFKTSTPFYKVRYPNGKPSIQTVLAPVN